MKDFGKQAVGYVRVSTKHQGKDGISLDAQRDAIERFATEMDYALLEIFEDMASGVGAQSFGKRVGLNAALDLTVREDAVLIVWDWDRLSRFSGFEKQVRKVLPGDERIKCVKKNTRLSEASQAGTFAHNERIASEVARTTKEGMAKKRAAGAVFGNPEITTKVQPLGAASYSSAANDQVHRIADVLRDLDDPFEITYREIAGILNEQGIRTLHNKEWNESRARGPVKKARELLRQEEEDALQSLPTYGIM